VHPVVDDAGKGLVWAGNPVVREPDGRPGTEAEMRLYEVLPAMIGLFQREGRVTYDLQDAQALLKHCGREGGTGTA
jgi:hypothetical protein